MNRISVSMASSKMLLLLFAIVFWAPVSSKTLIFKYTTDVHKNNLFEFHTALRTPNANYERGFRRELYIFPEFIYFVIRT